MSDDQRATKPSHSAVRKALRLVTRPVRRTSNRDAERVWAIEALAVQVAGAGSSLVLAADSVAMAEHAAERGLIAVEALAAVREERGMQDGATDRAPIREIVRPTTSETKAAVERGRLKGAIGADERDASPPRVIVEPEG